VIAFVRHGQTEVNAGGRLQGRVDAALSPLGRGQAAAIGSLLANEPVARVVTSPLVRARDTAAAITAYHRLEPEVDDRLVELDYGEWDGMRLADVAPDDWDAWRRDPAFAPPGGESLLAVRVRVAQFIEEVAGAARDQLVVAVSHVSPIKAAVCLALGVDESAQWRMHLALASVTRIDRGAGGAALLVSFNEHAHLRGLDVPG